MAKRKMRTERPAAPSWGRECVRVRCTRFGESRPRPHPSEPYMCVLYCSQRGYRVNLEPRFFAVGACGSEPYGRLTSWQPPLSRDARTTHEWRMRHCPPVFLRSRVVTRRSIFRPSLTRGHVSGSVAVVSDPRRCGTVVQECRARGVAGGWRGVRLVS